MSIMSMLVAGGGGVFTPLSLFAAGEQGAWYDPSDLTTMFEDSAGTTPVHTPGNGVADSPVGKILDKSGRGNHATQSTGTARPTLSAKYNLLTYTEQMDNAVWTKTSTTITANSIVAPDGTTTADLATTLNSNNWLGYTGLVSSAGTYTVSIALKRGNNDWMNVYLVNGSDYFASWCNVNTGTLGTVTVNGTFTSATGTLTSLGNGWYRLSVTFTKPSTAGCTLAIAPTTGDNTFSSQSALTYYAWGADLRVSNDGVGLPAYQRVVDANTYDSTGFPYYLLFDGIDDKLSAAGVDLSGTNKLSAFLAARKLGSSTDSDMLCGPWHDNAGKTFQLYYNGSASKFGFGSWGTSYAQVTNPTSEAPPIGKVITGLSDISSYIKLRLNGTQVASGGGQGTGNYRSQTIYLSSDTTYNANMRMFGAILRGASTTDADVTSTESWLNGKAKIY